MSPEEGSLLPRGPGKQGTRICCDLPPKRLSGPQVLFIGAEVSGYIYFGTYRQPQQSDLHGCYEMRSVPKDVKTYWAERLGSNLKSTEASLALTNRWPKVQIGWLTPNSGAFIKCGPEKPRDGEPVSRRIKYEEAIKITGPEVLEAFERGGFQGQITILKSCTDTRYKQTMTGIRHLVSSMEFSNVWNTTPSYSTAWPKTNPPCSISNSTITKRTPNPSLENHRDSAASRRKPKRLNGKPTNRQNCPSNRSGFKPILVVWYEGPFFLSL